MAAEPLVGVSEAPRARADSVIQNPFVKKPFAKYTPDLTTMV